MILIDPNWPNAPTFALEAVLALGAGSLFGVLHLKTLHYNIGLLASGSSPLLALASLLLRFALVAAGLAAIVLLLGALPLLLATAGLLMARTTLLYRVSR